MLESLSVGRQTGDGSLVARVVFIWDVLGDQSCQHVLVLQARIAENGTHPYWMRAGISNGTACGCGWRIGNFAMLIKIIDSETVLAMEAAKVRLRGLLTAIMAAQAAAQKDRHRQSEEGGGSSIMSDAGYYKDE